MKNNGRWNEGKMIKTYVIGYKNESGKNSKIQEIHKEVNNSINVDWTESTNMVMNENTKILCIEDTR